MRAFYCDRFVLPLPEGHRFPMEKYRLLRERVGAELDVSLAVPDAATTEDLCRVHTDDYVQRVVDGRLSPAEVRRMGFPWSPQLVERSKRSVGGTIHAARAALVDGVSVNLAGGTHHAFADHGEGFCVFNDVAVAARALQAAGTVDRCAVVDLDVHQGNGTATIFRDDPTVTTVSVHGAGNYPFEKATSDVDLPLEDGAGDEEFLTAVQTAIAHVSSFEPDVVFYIAGADPFEHDRLGRLAVSKHGLRARDELVFEACTNAGVPVAVVMSGGYAVDVHDTVDIHTSTIRAASALIR